MACRYTYQGKTYEAHEFDDVLRGLPADVAAKFMPGVSAVASGPFIEETKAYVALGLKRAIMMAVEAGQDRVAVVNGEQAADMFDLSKQVNSITAYKLGDGKYKISAIDSSGNQLPAQSASSDAELEGMIGKELASKVASQPGQMETYTGLDLKVGGEGMKAFYDQIVPQVMRDVAKKLGGRVSSIEFGSKFTITEHGGGWIVSAPDGSFYRGPKSSRPWASSRSEAKVYLSEKSAVSAAADLDEQAFPGQQSTQVAIEITPAMREKVAAEGVPLFSRARNPQTETPEFKAWFKDSKVVDEQGRPAVMYHGTTKGGFTVFDRLKSLGWRGPSMDTVGSWFSDNPSDSDGAGLYAAGGNSTIYPVYLSIQNPKVYRTFQDFLRHMHRAAGRAMPDGAPGRGSTEELRAELQADGFDGIEFQQTDNGSLMQDIKDMTEAVQRAKEDEYSVKRADRLPYTQKRERLEQTLRSMRKELDEFGSSTEFDGQRVFVAFEPAQIKSAIGNDGGFDPTDPDIRRSKAREPADERTLTSEFKAWFGDSKIVDQNGEPLVMYHGTKADNIQVFKRSTDGALGPGIYFTQSPEAADSYADGSGNGGGVIESVYVRAERPLELTMKPGVEAAMQIASDPKFADENFFTRGQARTWARNQIEDWAGIGDEDFPQMLSDAGYDSVVLRNEDGEIVEMSVLTPAQVKSVLNDGEWSRYSSNIYRSTGRAGWAAPSATKWDDMVYKLQDKHVDLKRVQEAIKDASGAISDDLDVYLKEELYHGRAAKQTQDFIDQELQPVIDEMKARDISLDQLDAYLHARHAREANELVAQRNPGKPGLQDGGSGMTNAEADAFLNSLDPARRQALDAAAAKVDAMIKGTRELLVNANLESRSAIDSWERMFKHYVPLMREDDGSGAGMGTGQGFSIKGREVKSRTGSTRNVVDILANIAMQRERAIVRAEKNRVATALVGLAEGNGNQDFWTVDEVPTTPTYNPKTGLVEDRPDNLFKQRENVLVAKVPDGMGGVKERAVIFDERDERAMRMAKALKNLDAAQLEGLLGASAQISRYFAAINTQWNPVFGIVNLMRDVQGALVNLGTTEIAGRRSQVARGTLPALRAIYKAMRTGNHSSQWGQLWDEFQRVGGQTGYRDQFATSADRADKLKQQLDPHYWASHGLGKFVSINGALKVPMTKLRQVMGPVMDWLSDYNEAMENGVRLSAYKAALDQGLSKERAASIAKNLTVNFNRKGQSAQQIGALYAFFNASMQGTARLGSVMFDMEAGKPKTLRLSGLGKKVVSGGLLLGTMQAMAMSAAGFGDDEPPEFVRERNLIIPTGDKTYVAIPMPLGLHVLPNLSRITTEWAMGGFRKTPDRAVSMVALFADSFNPIGNAGLSIQTIAPTAIDPLVALSENKDFTGKAIAKESRNPATPGHALRKDTATSASIWLSEAINTITGGNEYVAGAFSPTPDQIDYLAGQIGGGVWRELSKVDQVTRAAISGEEIPTNKIPLLGRMVGNSASQQAEGNNFRSNTERLNELETEIKGLRADKRFEEANALLRSRPDAYLMAQANVADNQVQRLRRQKSELIKQGAEPEKVKAIEERITATMARFNRAAEAFQARQGG